MSNPVRPLPNPDPGQGQVYPERSDYAERVPLLAAAAAQGAAVVVVLLLMAALPAPAVRSLHPLAWALLQGGAAAAIACSLRMETWWMPIHAVFVPGLVWTLSFEPPPELALAMFCILGSVFWGVSNNRVPLFLSSTAAARTVAGLLPRDREFAFLDLGCGLGGVLSQLARSQPRGQYYGVEIAPMPFALCWLRARLIGRNCRVSWEDFRNLDLGKYDVVYAYLSPAAMGGLWEKAAREMQPGSLLVSNSFVVPGVRPEMTLFPDGGGSDPLLVWRMRGA